VSGALYKSGRRPAIHRITETLLASIFDQGRTRVFGYMSLSVDFDVTALLLAWSQGNAEAREELIPIVYGELRRLAGRALRRESSDLTLQPTVLVHELYQRLIDQRRVKWRDRSHFYAVAGSLMRRIVVDHARRRKALRRGGSCSRVTLDTASEALAAEPEVDVIALDDALKELSRLSEIQARIVELRFFGGLSGDETAEALGISRRTVTRDWGVARVWLYRRLNEQSAAS
jgi:RNA polymerase sigma-70 factor (ECF subfamily)